MNMLWVKLLGEDIFLASVSVESGGKLRVSSPNPKMQLFVSKVVHDIVNNHPLLPLISGETIQEGDITKSKTMIEKVTPENPKYLSALADFLNYKQLLYNGKRVRFVLV